MFREAGRARSAMFAYWDNFLQAAEVMFRLLRAERSADFNLHLSAACEAGMASHAALR